MCLPFLLLSIEAAWFPNGDLRDLLLSCFLGLGVVLLLFHGQVHKDSVVRVLLSVQLQVFGAVLLVRRQADPETAFIFGRVETLGAFVLVDNFSL